MAIYFIPDGADRALSGIGNEITLGIHKYSFYHSRCGNHNKEQLQVGKVVCLQDIIDENFQKIGLHRCRASMKQ